MYTLILALHVILAVSLVGLVLLQQGKGADVGAVMSGGGANTLFGVGGASSLLVRMTTGVAIMFMLTSVLLVRFASAGGGRGGEGDAMKGSVVGSLVDEKPAGTPNTPSQAAPVVPVQPEGNAATQSNGVPQIDGVANSSAVVTTPVGSPEAATHVEAPLAQAGGEKEVRSSTPAASTSNTPKSAKSSAKSTAK